MKSLMDRARTSAGNCALGAALLFGASVAMGATMAMKPVVLVETTGEAGSSGATLVEEITSSVREAVLRTYARETYGTGAGFGGAGSGSGPVGLVADAFAELDRILTRRTTGDLADELAAMARDEPFEFKVDVIWVKDRERLASISKDLPGVHGLTLLWDMAKNMVLSGDGAAAAAGSLVSAMARIPLVNAKDVPGGVQRLFDQGADAYSALREAARNQFVPLHLGFSFRAYQSFVAIDMRTTVKPTEAAFELAPPEPADMMLATHVRWMPPQFAKEPPLARFLFRRSYGTRARANKPILQATFGRMYGKDVRNITFCSRLCTEEDQGGQKHIKKSGPTIQGKLRTPTTITGVKYKAMDLAVQALNSNMDLFILLNDLHFDFSNPRDPKLIESKSRIPMIVRLTDPLNGRHHYDVTSNRYGFDYMERFVNSKAAYKMNQTIKTKLMEADAALNRQMAGIMGTIREFLK